MKRPTVALCALLVALPPTAAFVPGSWQLVSAMIRQPPLSAAPPPPLRTICQISVNAIPDPYEVLGVDPKATPREIRAAFHAAARVSHPDALVDAPGGAEAEAAATFEAARAAADVLLDHDLRAKYDSARAVEAVAADLSAAFDAAAPLFNTTMTTIVVPAVSGISCSKELTPRSWTRPFVLTRSGCAYSRSLLPPPDCLCLTRQMRTAVRAAANITGGELYDTLRSWQLNQPLQRRPKMTAAKTPIFARVAATAARWAGGLASVVESSAARARQSAAAAETRAEFVVSTTANLEAANAGVERAAATREAQTATLKESFAALHDEFDTFDSAVSKLNGDHMKPSSPKVDPFKAWKRSKATSS